MKIFVTTDLHYREHWFRWLLRQAADYDLICIAGDLLDMFKGAPRMEQAREVSQWIRELGKDNSRPAPATMTMPDLRCAVPDRFRRHVLKSRQSAVGQGPPSLCAFI
jgi:Icc-related predicted phosphoesterase